MNNIITASRMNTLATCIRKHYWCNEVGLRSDKVALALRFGSAWARGMEAYWNELPFYVENKDCALARALPEGIDLEPYECCKVSALLAAYYKLYGPSKKFGKLLPEEKFEVGLTDGFVARGKMDGLGQRTNKRSVFIEAKTTGDSIADDSDYWLRLNFNLQLCQYYDAATRAGWDISEVIYDVVHKPGIKPKQIIDKDEQGLKIVKDGKGNRIYDTKTVKTVIKSKSKKSKDKVVVKEIKSPRQSASEADGYVVGTHLETPDEYSDRLYQDAIARPEFYFRRKEVSILESDIKQFQLHRAAVVKMILAFRENEANLEHPEDAHPRNVNMNNCRGCEYKSFCLQNIRIDIKHPPQGFSVKPFNPELEEEQNYESTENESATTT